MNYHCYHPSPLGRLLLMSDGQALTGLLTDWGTAPGRLDETPLREARQQLEAYFEGASQRFELPLELAGTDFQRQVWRELLRIPYGATTSYGELARRLGRPGASRAVGAANGSNPVAIIVPCHRVIGSNGKLTGYAGGLDRKRWLLDHEAAHG